jgi:hypothetical protein
MLFTMIQVAMATLHGMVGLDMSSQQGADYLSLMQIFAGRFATLA